MASNWDEHDDDLVSLSVDADAEPDEEPVKKRRGGPGRPKGSKNRSKESLLTVDKLEALYNRVKPFLPDDQRDYIEGVVSGDKDVDPLTEMKLLVRQMSILFSEAAVWHFDNKRVSQDFGNFANSLRMAVKDLYEMDKAEQAKADEQQGNDDLVRITERGTTLERLEALLSEHSS
jgi:hypothetical protein